MRYRTGRRNGHTIYAQMGAHADDQDQPVGFAVSPEAGRLLITLANFGAATPEGRAVMEQLSKMGRL